MGYSAVQRQQQAPNCTEVEPGTLGVRRGAADGPADENRTQPDVITVVDQPLLGTGTPIVPAAVAGRASRARDRRARIREVKFAFLLPRICCATWYGSAKNLRLALGL